MELIFSPLNFPGFWILTFFAQGSYQLLLDANR